jgi:RNA polymerase sigma factor (sigma-70 family)
LEASVLSQPAGLTAPRVRAPLRRFHSDERLIALIRAGDVAAFEALVQRYRGRLLSFCRHMLRSQEDAEDVLQEVFASSYRAIVADEREINVRPWLYRIARNMCLKHIARRRPAADGGVEELELPSGVTTLDTVGVREDLRQVVADVRELPETQRTALLLREIDGLSYDQIAQAMDTTVPGVKSLLVRARVTLAETAEGRLLTCEVVQLELLDAACGRLRLSGAARRHAKSCDFCGAYQSELGVGRRAAALLPLGPVALVRDLLAKLGLGAGAGAGASAAGAGAAAVGGGAASGACGVCGTAVGTTLGAIGGKAAVVVATAGLVAAGAANIDRTSHHTQAQASQPAVVRTVAPQAPADADVPAAGAPATAADPVSVAPQADKQKPSSKDVSSTPGTLPTTPADGGGAYPDSPVATPTQPSGGSGGASAPTDPASQPLHGSEPVQVQGFKDPSQTESQQVQASSPSSTSDSSQAPAGDQGTASP